MEISQFIKVIVQVFNYIIRAQFVFPNPEHKPNLLQVWLILLGVTLVGTEKSYHSSFTNNI